MTVKIQENPPFYHGLILGSLFPGQFAYLQVISHRNPWGRRTRFSRVPLERPVRQVPHSRRPQAW